MSQHYHRNAKTNSHVRLSIQKSQRSDQELAVRYGVSRQTVRKWRRRSGVEDFSSRPHRIYHALDEISVALIRRVRESTWMPLDELIETIEGVIPNVSRSTVYRVLCRLGLNRVPLAQREKARKFKAYQPGYLHMDVTYLPRLEGKSRRYLFVAIDRATRLMYYRIYPDKSVESSNAFLRECLRFFPFTITHILTDNGNEFTDRFSQGRQQPTGNHRFDKLCKAINIDHRLIQPFHPQTNGMVERANGMIKEATIKHTDYSSFRHLEEDLNRFLLHYLFSRRHSGLKKELNVRTPFEALSKWYTLDSNLFNTHPDDFRSYVFELLEQRGET